MQAGSRPEAVTMMKRILFAFLLLAVFALPVLAQKPRPRSTPKPPPTVKPFEPEVISRAGEERIEPPPPQLPPASGEPITGPLPTPDQGLQETVTQLAQQVKSMSAKIDQMESQQKVLLEMEMLTRAESRAEALRKQLFELTEKESALRAKLEQIEFDLKPESIARATAITGSLKPEDAREQRKKTLESEKTRINRQLEEIAANRVSLDGSLRNADALVEKLRAKLDKSIEEQLGEKPQP
jgi:hypothetical protein